MTKLGTVWAQDYSGIIGASTAMSWHAPADFRHFKESTMDCSIIIGRCSWETFGRVLPGRTNIIITRGPGYKAEGVLVVSSTNKAFRVVREETAYTDTPYIWITGEAQLYAETFPFLDKAVVTGLELDVAASAPRGSILVHAPALDPALWRRDEERSDVEWREYSDGACWKVSTWMQCQTFPRFDTCPAGPHISHGTFIVGCTVPSSPLLMDPTLRILVMIALFTYTAQNTLSVSIAPLSHALDLPKRIVGAAVSLAAAAVTVLSQFWGRRSIAWGRRRVTLSALFLALTASTLLSTAVWARAADYVGVSPAAGITMAACGPFFGAIVVAVPPTGQALVAEVTPDETSCVRGMFTFSGATNLSVTISSSVSSAPSVWWIFSSVHVTPTFILIALAIALICPPRDGDSVHPSRHLPCLSAEGTASEKVAPASSTQQTEQESASEVTDTTTLPPHVRWTNRRITPWIAPVFGIYFANGVVQIAMDFPVQGHGGLKPAPTVPVTALMLLANAAGAMLMQLIIVPRLGQNPCTLLHTDTALTLVAFACLTIAPSLQTSAVSTLAVGVTSGIASPGCSAGASLAVSICERGDIAGVISAADAATQIIAPMSVTALYDWMPPSSFLLALLLVALPCAYVWWPLHRAKNVVRPLDQDATRTSAPRLNVRAALSQGGT